MARMPLSPDITTQNPPHTTLSHPYCPYTQANRKLEGYSSKTIDARVVVNGRGPKACLWEG